MFPASPSYNETSPAVECGYPVPRGHGRLAGSWWPRSMLSCSVPVSDMSAMFDHMTVFRMETFKLGTLYLHQWTV